MTIPQTQNLQATLDELAGFLINIKIDMREGAELMPIFEIFFPSNWQVLEHKDFICETIPLGGNATGYKFSLSNRELTADAIVNHITRLIKYNEEIEEKQQQLLELQRRREIEIQAEIENLRTAFLESSPSSVKPIPVTAEAPTPLAGISDFMANVRKSKGAKPSIMVDTFVPERDEDESDDGVEEMAE